MSNIKIVERVVTELPEERPLVTGEKYKVLQSNGDLLNYTINSEGNPVFIRGVSNEQNIRLERLNNEQVTKLEGLQTQEELNDRFTTIIAGEKGSIGPEDPAPEEDGIWRAKVEGVYPNLGGLEVEEGMSTWFLKQGNVWTIYAEIDAGPATGIVNPTNTGATSGREVYEKTLVKSIYLEGENLYDYTDDTDGQYISSSNGTLIASANGSVSQRINVQNLNRITILNREGTTTYRFLSESGTPMKALTESGSEFGLFEGATNGRFLYKPEGAVEFQFTTRFSNVTTREDIIVNDSGADKVRIKPEFVDLDEVNEGLSEKINEDYLIDKGGNVYNYENDIEGYYISNSNGQPISSTTSSVSEIMPIPEGTEFVEVENRIGSNGFAFITNTGSRVIANRASGVPNTGFTTGVSPYYIPPGENVVAFQITTMFSFETSKEDIQVYLDGKRSDTIKPEFIPSISPGPSSDKRVRIEYNYPDVFVFSKVGDDEISVEYLLRENDQTTSNASTNIIRERINGSTFKGSTDDIAPARVDGSAIGGNHGWERQRGYTVNKVAHGKTFADIASIYVDGNGVEWGVWQINDVDNFVVVRRDSSTTSAPTGTLTYVENGANTASVSDYTTTIITSLRQFTIKQYTRLLADGVEITEDGEYYADDFHLVDNYDVIDLDGGVDLLLGSRPAGGYTENMPMVNFPDPPKLFNTTVDYHHYGYGKCTILHSFYNYADLSFSYHSFSQAGVIQGTSKIYVPKALPFNAGNKVYNLSLIEDYTAPTNQINLRAPYWEYPDNPPDRLLNFNDNYGLHLGYIKDVGVGLNRSNMVNNAIFLNTNRKMYPRAIDFSPAQTIPAGTLYQGAVFRNITPTTPSEVHTNADFVKVGSVWYLYLDYHKEGVDYLVDLPEEVRYKTSTILEKTDNVDVVSDVSPKGITINSKVESGSYGFVVFRFDN